MLADDAMFSSCYSDRQQQQQQAAAEVEAGVDNLWGNDAGSSSRCDGVLTFQKVAEVVVEKVGGVALSLWWGSNGGGCSDDGGSSSNVPYV